MLKKLKRMCLWSLAFILLTAGPLSRGSLAAETAGQGNTTQLRSESGKRLRHPSSRRQNTSTKINKHGQRTIIFVGGKRSNQSAATASNPIRSKKSNSTLNPQPIPPGKQRQPK